MWTHAIFIRSLWEVVFCPKNWDMKPREDIIRYADDLRSSTLNDLFLGKIASPTMGKIVFDIVKSYWDAFCTRRNKQLHPRIYIYH